MKEPKLKTVYVCSNCGETSPRWMGRCPSCGSWNTMNEDVVAEAPKAGLSSSKAAAPARQEGVTSLTARRLADISTTEEKSRILTGISELDRVLGGGIVLGGVVLLSGEPGVGKSTMLLQLCGAISNQHTVLYITGEESVRQVKLRAARLKVPQDNIYLAAENDVDEICGLIEKEKPDIIHINLFHRVLTASIVDAAKKHGIPVVFTMHDLNCVCPNHVMLDHGKICEACLHGNYWNCVKRVCFKDSRAKCLMAAIESDFNKRSGLYRKIDLFITPSECYKNKLEASGLTKSPIVHMKNFLPADTKYAVQGKRGDYVLYYGRLSAEKGILTLVRAMKKLENAPLIIVGTGPEEDAIRAEIEAHHLNQRVTMVGFQSGENLWQYVRNCACVVVPSEWYEASGYTACEAQAIGKPVVATNAGGLPENIVDGETGFISPMKDEAALADAIGRVMRLSDEEYQRMAEKSVANAKKLFDASGYVAKLLALYANLKRRGN